MVRVFSHLRCLKLFCRLVLGPQWRQDAEPKDGTPDLTPATEIMHPVAESMVLVECLTPSKSVPIQDNQQFHIMGMRLSQHRAGHKLCYCCDTVPTLSLILLARCRLLQLHADLPTDNAADQADILPRVKPTLHSHTLHGHCNKHHHKIPLQTMGTKRSRSGS